jgi:branched-chain amino acid transport system permease protein
MTTLVTVLVFGTLLGGVYAVMAYGIGLVYGVLRIVNLAHGATLMLAAYLAWTLNARIGLDPLAAIPLVAPAGYLVGWALYHGLVRRVAQGPPMASLLLLFGVSLCVRNLAYLVWTGDDRTVTMTHALTTVSLGVPLPLTKLVAFATALATTTALWALFRFTDAGRAIRAVAQDPLAAELSGLSVTRVSGHAFGLGTALGALGGVLLSTLYVVNPEFGGGFLLKSFCIIVLGGMDSMLGIFAGAVLLGVAETAAGVYGAAALQDAVSFVLLVAVLVVRPGGLPSLFQRP